jgi:hypothetical protein
MMEWQCVLVPGIVSSRFGTKIGKRQTESQIASFMAQYMQ